MHQLSLIPEIAARVDGDTLERLELIENLDLSLPQSRMSVDFPESATHFADVSREVKRFFALAVLEPNPKHRIVIGEKIDGLWHYFILHTKEYRDFCSRVFGAYLHHIPVLPQNKQELAADYEATRKLYRMYFGDPPESLWGDNDMICWGGCDEVRDDKLLLN